MIPDAPATRHPFRSAFVPAAIFIALAVGLLGAVPAEACPNCTEILSESTSGTPTIDPQRAQGLAAGFYWSILFMIATPFTIVGGLGAMLYFNIRKNAPQGARPGPRTAAASE